ERDGEGADGGGVDGPGADAPLLAAAVAGRHEPCVAPGDEGADADGSAELVGGDAHQVHTAGPEVHRQLGGRLHGVGVHGDAVLVGDRGDGGHVLDGAD